MIRYAGRIWSSLVHQYGIRATMLNVDQETWIADFIRDAYADKMPTHDAAFRIANEYTQHERWLDEKRERKEGA